MNAAETPEVAGPYKMNLTVDIKDAGPCRKHVKVTVAGADIDHFRNEALKELVFNAQVPGFRAGHVPRKLVERRFKKEVTDQVKQRILVDSLEQLAEDHQLEAINEPDLRVADLELPDEGDFSYEFDVEVRPEFDLPSYGGLTIERPTREIKDADIDAYADRFLTQFGELEASENPVQAGDTVTFNVASRSKETTVSHAHNQSARVRSTLRLQDAEIAGFDKLLEGAKAGDRRTAKVTVSVESPKVELRGENVDVEFEIIEVQTMKLPELTPEFLGTLGISSMEEFREEIKKVLERQVTFEQRQRARTQVLEKITESANWDLPETLVRRQVENALRREILEMQQAGFTDAQIRARENELRQRSISTTRQALKEHFVLDKIATQENIEVSDVEMQTEIHLMAMQRGESPRRVRARLEKQGMMENLAAQIRERKAIDFVLDQAQYKDVDLELASSDEVEAIPFAVCGVDPAAVPEAVEAGA
ncbi:MAG: trigger factor [Planctomycetaceae bacterium]|nr:trigger factor [Planctomycetaceae bacterium]